MQTATPWQTRPSSAVWFLLALCVGSSSLVHAQGIETIPSTVYEKAQARNVKLLCKSNKPVDECLVKVPGYPLTYDVHQLPTGLSYYGNDLPRGECGVQIDRFKASNVGKFVCSLKVGGEVFSGHIEIFQAQSPDGTEIELGEDTLFADDDGFKPNQTLMVTCESKNGLPAANLSWYLEDEPIDERWLEPVQIEEFRDTVKNRTLFNVKQVLKYFITTEDTGKTITCKAEHPGLPKGTRALLPLDISFPPLPLPTIYIGETSNTLINVTISAQPEPTTSWDIQGITVNEGQSVGPYQAYIPKNLGFGKYLVLLKINDATKQTEIYKLSATNLLGTQNYVIKASKYSSDENMVDDKQTGSGAIFWVISIWTFFCSVIASCLLQNLH